MNKSKRLVLLLLSLVLVISGTVVNVSAKKDQTDWDHFIGIVPTNKGLVFTNDLGESMELEISVDGQHWNPVKQNKYASYDSRDTELEDNGLKLVFHVNRDSKEIKFDFVATEDIAVTVDVKDSDKFKGKDKKWAESHLFLSLEELPGMSFNMFQGQVIDPLIAFNETANTYVWDAITDYAPAVVIPSAYGPNVTLHAPDLYNNNGTTLQDWQLITGGNYTVIDADSASFEWILENLREETSPSITDGETNVAGTEFCAFDERGTAYWTGSGAAIANDTNKEIKGSSALNMTFAADPQNSGVYQVYGGDQDWSNFTLVGFWFRGTGTNDDWQFILSDSAVADTTTLGTNPINYGFEDSNVGWSRHVFFFNGSPTSSTVRKIILRNVEAAPSNGVFGIDRTVADNPIWVPSEFYIGDNTTSIEVYNLDSTGADPRILFEWDINGTTDGSIYPGNLRNLEDEWLGSIAKQNATDWTLKANTTLPAGTYGEFLINTSVWIPSGVTRIALPTDFVANKLWSYDLEETIASGTPWVSRPFGSANGQLASGIINSGANIVFRRVSNNESQTAINPNYGGSSTFYNWDVDLSAQSYRYDFFLDNTNAARQNATVEFSILDLVDIATYSLSYWDGSAWNVFMDFSSGNITQPEGINGTSLDAAMYLEGIRTDTKAIVNATDGLADIGPITYSNNYGVMQRFGFTIELFGNLSKPSTPEFADAIKLRFIMNYTGDGSATFEFSGGDGDTNWGLDNIEGSAIELFDSTAGSPSPYLILLMAQKPDALWVTANAAQRITAVEFNATGTYKVLTDTALGTETTTAPTGETIQLTADRWQYYKNIAQFDRGERAVVDASGEGDAGFGWQYTSLPGIDEKVAFKVPLAPWQNATVIDADSGRSQMRLRAVVNMDTDSTYSYLVDLNLPASAQYVTSWFYDYFAKSLNVGPRAPSKNSTVWALLYNNRVNVTSTYVASPLAPPVVRQRINYIEINGTRVQSRIVPSTPLSTFANVLVNIILGNNDNPVVNTVTGGNITGVTYNTVSDFMRVSTQTTGAMSFTVDTSGEGQPVVDNAVGFSYDPATDRLTVNPGTGTNTVTLRWGQSSAAVSVIENTFSYLPLLGVLLIVLAASFILLAQRGLFTAELAVTFVVLAVLIIITAVILAQTATVAIGIL